jgi:epoxide hydrolase-like predicted phosphatase
MKRRRKGAQGSLGSKLLGLGKQAVVKPAIDPFDPDSFKAPDMMATGDGSQKQDVTPVKLLVFDMGHVFVDFDWNEVCKGFYERAGMSREAFKEVLAYVGSLGYEHGTITTEDFLAALNEKLSLSLSVAEFTQLWNHGFHENPEMAELLQSLKTRRPLYLLSNTNENHYNYLQGTYNVARHFQELILSYEVGLAKPDSRIFEVVLERSGLRPQECLFVDDLVPNIEAASKVGMQTIRFVNANDLKQQLTARGILTD